MTKSDFAKKYKTTERTVDKWLSKGYIRGARQENNEWLIPDDAKAPYTRSRVKPTSNQTEIMRSILRGVNSNRAVFAEVYKFEQEDFQRYINTLVSGGLIVTVMFSENIPYYQLTVAGMELMAKGDKEIYSALKELAGKFVSIAEVAATVFGMVGV